MLLMRCHLEFWKFSLVVSQNWTPVIYRSFIMMTLKALKSDSQRLDNFISL